MANHKKKSKNRSAYLSVLPLAIFTLLFVAGPLIYMIILSFMTNQGRGHVALPMTLANYGKITETVTYGGTQEFIYLKTFVESFKLALISTGLVILIGYPFGYFMAKLSATWKGRLMSLLMLPFWVSSLLRLYGWVVIFRANGPFDQFLMSLGIIDRSLKLLYTYPTVVVAMVYALLPFMIFSVYSSAEKLDWTLIEAARDLGAKPFYAFVTISLKLTLPGLLSGIILTFIPSMGLFFIADIIGGGKIMLIGNLIQDQMTKANNMPFAAALSVLLMLLTSIMIAVYRKLSGVKDLEGLM